MRVGTSLNMLTKEGRTDASVVGEHLALGDLAEPLGFDSVFALEHHFTGYAMSPAPCQLLSYIAGRTKRITLGPRSSRRPDVPALDQRPLSRGRIRARRPCWCSRAGPRWPPG